MAKLNEVMNKIEKQYLANEVCFQEFCSSITGTDLAELTLPEILEVYGALSNKIEEDVVTRENVYDDIHIVYGKELLGKDFTMESSTQTKAREFFSWLINEYNRSFTNLISAQSEDNARYELVDACHVQINTILSAFSNIVLNESWGDDNEEGWDDDNDDWLEANKNRIKNNASDDEECPF